ncbi:MAG: glycosyltransferase family 2 protein, partial [Acidimicrobiia bacterium]
MRDDRARILYLRPSVDDGGFDRATIDSFARLDRARWASHLIVTEPSLNRRLHQLEPLAEEILDLPERTTGAAFPELILSFIESHRIGLLSVGGSRLGFDLLPDIAGLPDPPAVLVHFADGEPGPSGYVGYVTRRYGDLVDAFLVPDERTKQAVAGNEIPQSRIEVVPSDPEDAGLHQGELFERLLADRQVGAARRAARSDEKAAVAPTGAPLKLPRNPPPERTVSVGVPCFRHGIYLDECIHSIKLQFLRPKHIVIVDDGSDDPETLEALERSEADPSITVLRQPANLGPSAARNRALEVFDTDYALWIDADDQLLPGALDSMIAKLEEAPEDVGFVYPHAKHTGSRSDYAETPPYELLLRMGRDVCPSPSMYDMRVFDGTGVSFSEDMVTGHESWDLTLQLAERGIAGQPADGPTFLYRKRGFSRFQAFDRGRDRRRSLEARGSDDAVDWTPLETQPLCRHLHLDQSTRVITNDRNPPPGFRLEFDLGVTHTFALPGTQRLVARAGTFELSDEQDELSEGQTLGYIEDRPFPLCESLELCEMPESGERVLVAGPEDPLHGIARPIALLGWVQAFPLQPRGDLPYDEPGARVVALYRRLDSKSGQHLYSVEPSDGESPMASVGSLFNSPGMDRIALRLRK